MSTESKLIPDLQNIVNIYLTPNEYFEAIGAGDITFNYQVYQEVLKNYRQTFPLRFYENAHQTSMNIIGDVRFKNMKIDPKLVASILIKYRYENGDQSFEDILDEELFDIIDATI